MSQEPVFETVWPLGVEEVPDLDIVERPESLSGRVVAFIWDDLFKGPEMFELIKSEIDRAFEDVTYVDYAEFGNIHGAEATEVLASLPERLGQHKVDAAIVAVGA